MLRIHAQPLRRARLGGNERERLGRAELVLHEHRRAVLRARITEDVVALEDRLRRALRGDASPLDRLELHEPADVLRLRHEEGADALRGREPTARTDTRELVERIGRAEERRPRDAALL